MSGSVSSLPITTDCTTPTTSSCAGSNSNRCVAVGSTRCGTTTAGVVAGAAGGAGAGRSSEQPASASSPPPSRSEARRLNEDRSVGKFIAGAAGRREMAAEQRRRLGDAGQDAVAPESAAELLLHCGADSAPFLGGHEAVEATVGDDLDDAI